MNINISIGDYDTPEQVEALSAAIFALAAAWPAARSLPGVPVASQLDRQVYTPPNDYPLTQDTRLQYPEPEAPGPQSEAPKRTRRTKAEIEAEKSAAAQAGSEQTAASSAPSAGPRATDATTAAPAAPSSEATSESSEVTKQSVLDAVSALSARGVSPLVIQEALIKNFNVERVGKLAESQYAEAVAVFSKL